MQYLPLSGNNIVIKQLNEIFDIYPTRQVFNKLLSLANSAAQPKADYSLWTNLLLSTSGVRLWNILHIHVFHMRLNYLWIIGRKWKWSLVSTHEQLRRNKKSETGLYNPYNASNL